MPFKAVGDWNKLKKVLTPLSRKPAVRAVRDRGMAIIGITVRNEMKDRIKARKYLKNHPWTIAMKSTSSGRGDQPLVDHGQLVKSINYKVDYKGLKEVQVFIGVRKSATAHGGTSMEVFELAKVLHEGAVIPVTKAMRMYLLSRGFPLKKSTQFIIIPPRPFVRDVVNDPTVIEKVKLIYLKTVLEMVKKGSGL